MPTSTSTPAQFLSAYQAPAYLIPQVSLNVQLHPRRTLVTSCLHIKTNPAAAPAQLADLILDGVDLELLSVKLNGQQLSATDYAQRPKHLEISAASLAKLGVTPASNFQLETTVALNPEANTFLEGLYLSSGNFCTQCEAQGFRRITFYLDRPDVLAVFTCRLEADAKLYPVLLSNGNLIAQGQLEQGRHFASWHDPHPKPAYLFALVAGDLHLAKASFTTASGREVALELWVEQHNLHKCDFALQSLASAMRWDEENYACEYDLDTYMLVAVDDFNMGAMENKGLNIFNSACVLAEPKSSSDQAFHQVESIIAHEYFHNWSGNRVTLRDWFQLALKEGFTVLRDQEFSADMNSPAVERIQQVKMLRSAQFAEDAGPNAHPVRPASYIEIDNFYTLTIYEKGAELVRMLRELLGQATFRKAAREYFARFDGMAVTLEDFIGVLSEVSERDLSQFMLWYSQAGTPQIQAQGVYDPTKKTFSLHLSQHTPPTPGQNQKQPLLIPIQMGLLSPEGQELDLIIAGENKGQQLLVELNSASTCIQFENLAAAPVPSLLRGFSAPVKLDFAYSPADLSLLMTQDSDGFNRWEAGQRLALLALQQLVNQIQTMPKCDLQKLDLNQPEIKQLEINQLKANLLPEFKQAFAALVTTEFTDAAVLAQMLQLPSLAYLWQQYEQVDVNALHLALQLAHQELAQEFAPELLRLYTKFHASPEQEFSASGAAKAARSLKNTCLHLLLNLSPHNSVYKQAVNLATAQFRQANNMTDQLAALTGLVHFGPEQEAAWAVAEFFQEWQEDTLVMDSWFRVQATNPQANTLQLVQKLEEHPAFSLRNPNKVRALLGSFANNNQVNFHQEDGAAYAYLARKVLELDAINPQIAARLVLPLTDFARLDAKRQNLCRQELARLLAQENLSAATREVVAKAV